MYSFKALQFGLDKGSEGGKDGKRGGGEKHEQVDSFNNILNQSEQLYLVVLCLNFELHI